MKPTPEMIEEAINIKKDGKGQDWSKKIGTLMKAGLIAYEPDEEYFFVIPEEDRVPVKKNDIPGLFEWFAEVYNSDEDYSNDLILLFSNMEDYDISKLFEKIGERNYKRSFLNLQSYTSYIFGEMMEKGEIVWTGKKNGWEKTELFQEPLTLEQKRQLIKKEQKEFLDEWKSVGRKAEQAVKDGDVKTIEECREYFYNAIDFFKERPWMTATGMKCSYQILMKLYAHLGKLAPEKYPDIIEEDSRLTKLTNRLTYPDGFNWY